MVEYRRTALHYRNSSKARAAFQSIAGALVAALAKDEEGRVMDTFTLVYADGVRVPVDEADIVRTPDGMAVNINVRDDRGGISFRVEQRRKIGTGPWSITPIPEKPSKRK